MATKAEIQKLNQAMARFLKRLCRDSDRFYNGCRSPTVEANYKIAKKYIKRAAALRS